ncbi:MAG: hypothetical protein R3C58_15880 [Parvularculaceae bacterium]
MPLIVVSSKDAAEDAFAAHEPGFAISILDKDDAPPPHINALAGDRRLVLDTSCGPECGWCPDLVAFARRWAATDDNILIHCHRGVARSMAVAYILMCVRENGVCEKSIAERLRKAAPHADPNLLLVSQADAMLDRDDRMVGAVLDMCPCCATVEAPVVILPVAP